MKTKTIIYFTFFLLLLCNCKKEPSVYYVQDSFKEWTVFQKGSYWVFLNENNKSFDSNFINENPSITYIPSTPPQEEIIGINLNSNFIEDYSIRAGAQNISFLRISLYAPDIDPIALSTWVTNGTSNQASNYCWLVKVHSTLLINGNTFNNVIQMRDSNNLYDGTKSIKNYYYVKNVGLVKLERKLNEADTIWSLVRWQVLQ